MTTMKLSILILLLSFTLHADMSHYKLGTNSAVVFMYHHFGKSKYPSTNIKLEQFRDHLNYLKDNHYNVWPLSRVILAIQNKTYIPQKTVALSVDDAYISVYTHAYPMLKRKGFPYTVFVNTNAIGTKSINYMSWEQMQEMQRYGAEFSNHSKTHAYLIPKRNESTLEWQEKIKEEVEGAQKSLQENLGSRTNTHPKILSYPFGEYTEETAKYIQSLGYVGIAQTSGALNHNTDLKRVPRFAMSEKFASMDEFKLKLHMLPLPVKSVAPWGTTLRSNPPKLTIKLHKPMQKLGCYVSSGKAINVKWNSPLELEVIAERSLRAPRDRYTCTSVDENGQWYWYSHLWIVK